MITDDTDEAKRLMLIKNGVKGVWPKASERWIVMSAVAGLRHIRTKGGVS